MKSYRDLIAWQRAMDLAAAVYTATAKFPSEERFGLTNQIRRAAVSVVSNIAEGAGRLTTRDWQHFLGQSRGSLCELETQLLLAERLHFGEHKNLQRVVALAHEVGRILNGLLRSTRSLTARKPLNSGNNVGDAP